ncbi:MAG: HDOD domain-containing protein [Phycisphaerae bacterium]|nr:HDOD domain-containing protein [Phycisphaerae bacterium]
MPSERRGGDWSNLRTKERDRCYLEKLLDFLERRLEYMRGRADRIETIVTRLGVASGLPQEGVSALRIGARYCDVGLHGIPEALLVSDRPFDASERRLMETHVRLSGQLLNLGFFDFPEVLEAVWFHHERMDGTGPLGLKAYLIPPSARILSVAGAIESMYFGRPHRSRMAPDAILGELYQCAGTQFARDVVDVAARIQNELFLSLEKVAARDAGEDAPSPAKTPIAAAPDGPEPFRPVRTRPAAHPIVRSQETVLERLDQVEQVTALPSVVCEVLMLAGNQYADRRELARVIEQDVALTARVLALANSCGRGVERGRISTVDDAVARLGFSAVKQMATGMGILRTVSRDADTPGSYVRLWEHCFACALLSRQLAAGSGGPSEGNEYLVGLLHDLGKFILVDFFADRVEAFADTAGLADEKTLLGLNHAELGAEMMSRWGLPAALVDPVRSHHRDWDADQPLEPEDEAVLLLQVADGLALAFGFQTGLADYFPVIPGCLLSRLPSLQSFCATALQDSVQKQMRETALMLGMFEEPVAETCKPAPVTPVPVTYIPCEEQPMHFLAVWLEHACGLPTQTQVLDALSPDAADEGVPIVDLTAGLPTPTGLARLENLSKRSVGLLVTSQPWQDAGMGPLPSGWQVVRAPLSVLQLEKGLQRLLADSPATLVSVPA